MLMGISKLDLLIVFVIIISIIFSLNAPKYLQSKGKDVFAAVMTYKTLKEKGLDATIEVTGITNDYDIEKVSGIILGTTPSRIYIWDGNYTWLVFDKEEFVIIEEEPMIPYIHPSLITIYPTSEVVVSDKCEGDFFVNKIVFLKLNDETNEVLCDYIMRKVWKEYGGEVICKYGGNDLELNLNYIRNLDDKFIHNTISDFGYYVMKEWVVHEECLMIE